MDGGVFDASSQNLQTATKTGTARAKGGKRRGKRSAGARAGSAVDTPSAIENLLRLLTAANESDFVSSGKARHAKPQAAAPGKAAKTHATPTEGTGKDIHQPGANATTPESATVLHGVSNVIRGAAIVFGCIGYLAVGAVLSVLVFVYNVLVDQHGPQPD